jgi:hypothetical protein
MTNNKKEEKDLLLSDYQEIRHAKNAVVVGDEVCVEKYTNDTKRQHTRTWRKAVRVEIGDGNTGKVWFEDSNRPIQIKDWRAGKDSIITTKAWEKAFNSLLKGDLSESSIKFKKRCVVSYEKIDDTLCVVISERQKLKKQWYFKHDDGTLLKENKIDTKDDVIWVCRNNSNTVIAIRQEKKQETDVEMQVGSNWFEQPKTKGKPVIWNADKVTMICEACPWLLTINAVWKIACNNAEPEVRTITGQELIDFLEGRI